MQAFFSNNACSHPSICQSLHMQPAMQPRPMQPRPIQPRPLHEEGECVCDSVFSHSLTCHTPCKPEPMMPKSFSPQPRDFRGGIEMHPWHLSRVSVCVC